MFIQTEDTPNPATMKFMPGRPVLGAGQGAADFPNRTLAKRSPLARALFEIEGVSGVFLGHDFIAVTRSGAKEWDELRPVLLEAIMEHFVEGRAVLEEGGAADENIIDSEIVVHIRELLDTHVRPAVARDGGDIVFHSYEDGVVYLSLRGACAGCPSATITLKNGVERMLKHYIPEVKEVRQVRQIPQQIRLKSHETPEREARETEALRENLRKRKQQQQARQATEKKVPRKQKSKKSGN